MSVTDSSRDVDGAGAIAADHAVELITGAVMPAAGSGAALVDSPAVAGGRSLYLPLPQTLDTVQEERAHRGGHARCGLADVQQGRLDEGVGGTSRCGTLTRTPTG